jgi:hypothetical protein
VNAALKLQVSSTVNDLAIRAACRNDLVVVECDAFRSHVRQVGKLVEDWDPAATKLLDLGKGVPFPTVTVQEGGSPAYLSSYGQAELFQLQVRMMNLR